MFNHSYKSKLTFFAPEARVGRAAFVDRLLVAEQTDES